MRIPWLKKQNISTKLGIFIAKQRVDICALSTGNDAISVLDSSAFSDVSELVKTLNNMISKHNLQASTCHVVLSNQLYQLLQIDKPSVPDDEIASTLPFIAKEFISESIGTVVFDYFSVPNQNKINLVYCAKSLVELIVTAIQQAKLELLTIGIEELATANLFNTSADVNRKSTQMLIAQQDYQEVNLTIIHDNQVYFSRRLRGFSRLRDLKEDQLDTSLLDNFSLEIQRSADFAVSQLKLPEVKDINLALPSTSLEPLIARLQLNFTIPVISLKHAYISENIDTGFLPAIGGALEIL
ncbi:MULTISPECIES: type IV pilus biogenesis protein PilM [unclassified Moritella]|uniref:type IV pilus biogenesis protein PilM n=1 Tax=unclassified Moritella TaxID=2637987 RepID=UPI001BAC0E78|nr:MULTISPECIES: biogenesis protein MshI [unclassified Moritella]QUM78999.1 biogenesis protein MshI [Moritella sp. 5]QUM83201.1 biogenesis protein MshI [Moritella sp. 28]QUM87502.1 biogenesis protein MshI [Moritella sp. 36]